MVDPSAPAEVIALADERALARSRRDYGTADGLKAQIEAAGWKVVDFGVAYELEPAAQPDVTDGERTLHGSVGSVPSRLAEPPVEPASVIVIATEAEATAACLERLAATAPPDTQVVLVTGPGIAVDAAADERVATAVPFAAGDALQAALRRTTGAVVVVLEPELIPTADVVTPIIGTLADPTVAIVTAYGLRSSDLHRYHPAETGDATTVASGCYGFRRADAIGRGPVDGRLALRGSVAAWLGLLLRDEGPDAEARRAVVAELSLERRESETPLPPDHARLARRDSYRLTRRFRDHEWLAGKEPPQGRLVRDRAGDGEPDDDAEKRDHADEA